MPTLDKQEAAIRRAIESLQSGYERRIMQNYRDGLNGIRDALSVLYEKYASDGVLTYSEMTRYNRLKGLHDQLVEIMGPVFSKNGQLVEKLTRVQYQESFYRYAWAIDQTAGVELKWGLLNEKTVEAAVGMGPYRELRGIAIKNARGTTLAQIDRTITQGLIRGESYPNMAKALKGVLDRRASDYLMIARTEGQRAAVIGQQANYFKAQDLGVELTEVWDAALDDRTRPEHGALDGVPKDEEHNGWYLDGEWVTGPVQHSDPAQSINCRCRVRAEIAGYGPKVRRIRDEGVVPYKSYNQWAKDHGFRVNRDGLSVNRYGQVIPQAN
jgi:hypothetical protein